MWDQQCILRLLSSVSCPLPPTGLNSIACLIMGSSKDEECSVLQMVLDCTFHGPPSPLATPAGADRDRNPITYGRSTFPTNVSLFLLLLLLLLKGPHISQTGKQS